MTTSTPMYSLDAGSRKPKAQKLALLDLPAEMLVAVADQANKDDLRPLRGTCRALRDATEDAFLSAFFARRRHLYSRTSLQLLINVTADVRIARQIKHLEIVTAHLTDYVLEHPSNVRMAARSREPEFTKPIDSGRLVNAPIDAKRFFTEEVLNLDETKDGTQLFSQVMQNLCIADTTPSIAITSVANDEGEDCIHGLAKLRWFCGCIQLHRFEICGCDNVFANMLEAMIASKMEVKEMALWSVAGRQVSLSPLAKLASLRIEFAAYTDGHSLGEWENKHFIDYAAVFAGAMSLRSLAIEYHVGAQLPRLDTLFDLVAPFSERQLHTLDISYFDTHIGLLIKSLNIFRETLRMVTLKKLLVPGRECYGHLFDWMKKPLSLERFDASFLSKKSSPVATLTSDDSGVAWVVDGNQCVEQLIKTFEQGYGYI